MSAFSLRMKCQVLEYSLASRGHHLNYKKTPSHGKGFEKFSFKVLYHINMTHVHLMNRVLLQRSQME